MTAAIDWQNTVFTAIEGEAADAAQSVLDAATQVGLAEDQVDLAAAQVVLATDEADRAQTVADAVAAQANFGGLWSSLTGAVSPPLSVYFGAGYWQLLQPLADVTSVTPGSDSATWLPMAESSLDVGAITYSFVDLVADGLFVRPGNSFLQAEFPELFGFVGIGSAEPTAKLPNPSVLPASAGNGVAFSPDGVYMSAAHWSSPYITIYKREGDTFTKLTNPSVLPASTGYGVAFSPNGVYMSVAHQSSPFITIYKRDGDTFTKLPNPSDLPANTGRGVAFSPDGVYMSVAHQSSPYITIYKRDGDTFAKLTNPSVLPAGMGLGVAFSPDNIYMSVAHSDSPNITIYRSDFPFDIETEFYVPDVTDLPGIPVGGWTPSVSPKAYVRAK